MLQEEKEFSSRSQSDLLKRIVKQLKGGLNDTIHHFKKIMTVLDELSLSTTFYQQQDPYKG